MAGGFDRNEVAALLAKCHRRCCICHRFCGVKIETDHIVPHAEGGTDAIDNAIPVCFECHAEIHSYNDKHPRGRKFTSEELHFHKEQWLTICATQPNIFTQPLHRADVGPIQALIDELEYNRLVAGYTDSKILGALFLDSQFHLAIHEGAIATLDPILKQAVLDAYRVMSRANSALSNFASQPETSIVRQSLYGSLLATMIEAENKIQFAADKLLQFLGSEELEP